MKKCILLIFLIIGVIAKAQTGIIRGSIIDKQSETKLVGVTIILEGIENKNAISDSEGNFVIHNVPLGRQNLKISYTGYESATISEIDVVAGKEVIVTISLIEKLNTLEEVKIESAPSKSKSINKMSAVSVRQFTLDEVSRYSGGRNDVARLTANFAGVSAANDSRNDIVVRGNSPTGMLWRIDGIPIPSPNHFATIGTTGSPVSALNPNLLANSDFITSAFPAEYGNALSGVFDLNFRKGNREKYEYTLSMGEFSGLEFMAEGPMLKKNGSFVAAGRYGVAQFFGAGGASSPPKYNDFSFNLDFGKSKAGNFSMFAIVGNSNIDFLGKNAVDGDLFAAKDEDAFVKSNFGSFGLKNAININAKTYLKTTIGGSYSSNSYHSNRYYNLGLPSEFTIDYADTDNRESRITFSTLLNSKINKKFTLRTGILLEKFILDAYLSGRDRQIDGDLNGFPDFITVYNVNDKYTTIQPYLHGQFRFTDKIIVNAGLHSQYFSLNKEFVVEPRASVSYAVTSKSTINFGYGIHHQNVAAPLLFQKELVGGDLMANNEKLDLVRSQHYVIGYDIRLAEKWRAKVEVYYQSIDKAAVEKTPSSYSSLTEGADFIFAIDKPSLVSNGKGHNKGIELTIEKFYSKGYHVLFTTSLFDSKYIGSDGVERNSPFNNRYVLNVLGGKEFKLGKNKRNVFYIDTKMTASGGRYYTPIDLTSSSAVGFEVKDNSKAYSEQYSPYFRLDIKFGLKFNSKLKKQSHQFYFDMMNATNKDNIFISKYNRLTNKVESSNQIGFFPDFGYKFQF